MVREPVHFHHKPGLVIDSALGCDLIELYTHFFKKQVLLHIFFYVFFKFRIHEKRRLYTVYSIYREYKELVFGTDENGCTMFFDRKYLCNFETGGKREKNKRGDFKSAGYLPYIYSIYI
jgi:hypothetical protein